MGLPTDMRMNYEIKEMKTALGKYIWESEL